MPELPEVETVKSTLAPLVCGKRIDSVEVFCSKIIKNMEVRLFQEKIAGRKITEVDRKGKYLLFHLDQGFTLVIHLRMTGQLTFCDCRVIPGSHTHVIFHLSSIKTSLQKEFSQGTPQGEVFPGELSTGVSSGGRLWFTDIRKFGLIYLVPTGHWVEIKGLHGLGYEPLAEEFTLPILQKLLIGKRRILKAFLLDQGQIAGIGNIYADEILHEACLHPQREINSLQTKEITALFRAIKLKLAEGVAYRGTSLRDYVDGRGKKGGFQERLQVYGRKGLPCSKCGTPLQRIIVAGRGTVFCPHCQR